MAISNAGMAYSARGGGLDIRSDLGTKVHASVISDTTEIILKRTLDNKSSI